MEVSGKTFTGGSEMAEISIQEKRADLRFTVKCVSCDKVFAIDVPASRMVRSSASGTLPLRSSPRRCSATT